MSNRTLKALKGLISSYIHYGITILLQIFLMPVVLKYAGQETLGVYTIIMQIIGYGILFDMGFSVALGRYLARTYGDSKNKNAFSEVFSIGRIFLFVSNIVISLFVILISIYFDEFIHIQSDVLFQSRYALVMLSIWITFRSSFLMYNHGLLATQNMAIVNLIAIISNVIRLLLTVALVMMGYGIIGMIIGNIVSELGAGIAQKYFFNKKNPGYIFLWKIKDINLLKEMFQFGIKYFGVNVSALLFMGSDSFVAGHLYGAASASVFYITKLPSFLFFQLIFKIADNAGPAINELISIGSWDAIRNAYFKILRYSLLLVLPGSIGTIIFNKIIIKFWVGEYQYAGSIMTISLAVFGITQVVNHVNALIVIGIGNLKWWSEFSIVIGIISLGLSFMLGKYFGLQFIMVALALMDVSNLIFLFKRCMSGLNISFKVIFKKAIMPAVMTTIPLIVYSAGIYKYNILNNGDVLIYSLGTFFLFFILWMFGLIVFGLNIIEKQRIFSKCHY